MRQTFLLFSVVTVVLSSCSKSSAEEGLQSDEAALISACGLVPDWVRGKTYVAGDVVQFTDGKRYVAKLGNPGFVPTTSPNYWAPVVCSALLPLPPTAPVTIEAESMEIKTAGASTTVNGATVWNLWSNGSLENKINFPSTGPYDISVLGFSDLVDGLGAEVDVRIDGEPQGKQFFSETSATLHIYNGWATAGVHRVSILFLNDTTVGGDRNLLVDKVTIAPPTVTPTACSTNPCTHGLCTLTATSYSCACENGWSGRDCEVVAPPTCVEGAITSACRCGGSTRMTGACCAGVWNEGTCLVISVPLALDKTSVKIGETLSGTVSYRNTSAAPITVQKMVIAGCFLGVVQYLDLAPQPANVTIQPGATYTVTASRLFTPSDLLGGWRSYATYQGADGVWRDGPDRTFTVAAAFSPAVPTIAVDRNLNLLIAANGYWGHNDTWGSGWIQWGTGANQYEQYMGGVVPYGTDGAIALRTTWRWPNPPGSSEVKGFPGIIYGLKPGYVAPSGRPGGLQLVPDPGPVAAGETGNTPLPLQLPIQDMKARHRLAVVNTTGQGHVSYDLWLQEFPAQTSGFGASSITHEIMIPLWNWGGYGAHPNGRNPGWYDHDVTIDGIDFAVYVAKSANGVVSPDFGSLDGSYSGRTGWKFIVFQPKVLPLPDRVINLAAIVNYVATRQDSAGTRWATCREYLMSIELGVEPVVGAGDVTIYDFKAGLGM